MTTCISSGESNSSDDEYYNNFTKYKAKAALTLRRVEANDCTKGQNSKRNRKNGGTTAEKVSMNLPDVEDIALTSRPFYDKFTSRTDANPEICLVPTVDTATAAVVNLTGGHSIAADSSTSPIIPSFSADVCRIIISSKGQQKIFFSDLNEPLANVIEEFAERTNVDPKRVNLYTKQYKRCDPKDTPMTLGLSEKCNEIELDAFEDLEESEGKRIALKYQMKGRKPTIARVLPDATFASLKELLCTDHGLEPSKTRLLLGSIDLIGDEETPNSLGLEDGDCIDVIHFEN